ncbi:MAG: PD40 domain-containing protein [Gemmatimonadetes bacterium]|nr:PD40 domain-containing protein [Gemmatimonadota bacterium]
MSRPTTRLLLPLLLLGCAHSDPFPSGDPGDNGPFNGPPPQLLTLHLGQDRTPAWSPDGSRLLYSFNQVELPDQDACLGALPPAGGTRSLEHCRLGDTFHELVEVREWPALSPTGQLAWVEQENLVGVRVPTAGAIRVGTLSPLNPGIVVRSLPYTPPGGALHLTATHLAWLGTDSLVYVGADFLVTRACNGCKLDSLIVGREVIILDATTSPATTTVVPGTSGATAVAPAGAPGAIVYTLPGDGIVYRRQLATGVVDSLWDFSATGIARDPALQGHRLVAVVGGNVTFTVDPLLGPVQQDAGGPLYVVNLADSTVTAVSPGDHAARHPVFRPQQQAIVAEAVDTVPPFDPNLYLYLVP